MPKKKEVKREMYVTIKLNEEGETSITSNLAPLQILHMFSNAQAVILNDIIKNTDIAEKEATLEN